MFGMNRYVRQRHGRASPDADGALLEDRRVVVAVAAWPRWRFSRETQEDIAQKVVLELSLHPERLRQAGSRVQLVRRIAVRRCIDEVRRQIRERGIFFAGGDGPDHELLERAAAGPSSDPVRAIYLRERADSLRRVMEEIDDACRRALQAFYFEGRSYREMAAEQGVGVNTAGTRLARCIARLRNLCAQHAEMREYLNLTDDGS